MKPTKTPETNLTFKLPGGTEENDLPAHRTFDSEGQPCVRTTWELNELEREVIARGGRIYLVVWGVGHPPVALGVEA